MLVLKNRGIVISGLRDLKIACFEAEKLRRKFRYIVDMDVSDFRDAIVVWYKMTSRDNPDDVWSSLVRLKDTMVAIKNESARNKDVRFHIKFIVSLPMDMKLSLGFQNELEMTLTESYDTEGANRNTTTSAMVFTNVWYIPDRQYSDDRNIIDLTKNVDNIEVFTSYIAYDILPRLTADVYEYYIKASGCDENIKMAMDVIQMYISNHAILKVIRK